MWYKPQAQWYWETAKVDVFGNGRWYEKLWMSKPTFGVLYMQLTETIHTEDNNQVLHASIC